MSNANFEFNRSLSNRTDEELEEIYLRAHRVLSCMWDQATMYTEVGDKIPSEVRLSGQAMIHILGEEPNDITAAILGREEGGIAEDGLDWIMPL